MQGARRLRNEAYFSYAAMTKDEAQRRRWTFYEAVRLDQIKWHPNRNQISPEDLANTKKTRLAQPIIAQCGHIDRDGQKGYEVSTSIPTEAVRSIGEVAEWLKAPLSKSGILLNTGSWVRIPPSPPEHFP